MEKLTIGNLTFEPLPACDFGDYGGSGSIGRANLNVLRDQFKGRVTVGRFYDFDQDGNLKESHYRSLATIADSAYSDCDLIILKDDYSSESAYLRVPSDDESDDDYRAEYQDIVSALADYPVLSDDELSRVEMEWADSALGDYALSDVGRSLSEDALEKWEAIPDDKRSEIFYSCADQANIYFVPEHNGGYWAVDQIAPYVQIVLDSMPVVRAVRLDCDTCYQLPPEEAPYEEPDQFGRTSANFISTNTHSTEAYVAEWCNAHHYVKG